eukprot:6086896-Amphidinium_carterae.1
MGRTVPAKSLRTIPIPSAFQNLKQSGFRFYMPLEMPLAFLRIQLRPATVGLRWGHHPLLPSNATTSVIRTAHFDQFTLSQHTGFPASIYLHVIHSWASLGIGSTSPTSWIGAPTGPGMTLNSSVAKHAPCAMARKVQSACQNA